MSCSYFSYFLFSPLFLLDLNSQFHLYWTWKKNNIHLPLHPIPLILCVFQENLCPDVGGEIHWTQCQDFQWARQPHSQSSQNCDRCPASLHWVSLELTDPTAPITWILHCVPWFLSLSCRDQSCTDILEIYNKVKAEDLSSTDEEEEVRSFPYLLKFSTWKKFWFLLSLYFMGNCTEFWRWGCLGSPGTISSLK